MANETEYVVVVHKDVNLEEFDAELAASTGEGPIPNREVKVANPRWGSKRMTHWMLTDAEVNLLKTDERVLTVEIPADQRTDITIGLHATQTGIWYRGASTNSDHKNWGLRRVIAEANSGIFDNATTLTGDYTHQLTGTGVDFVVQDSGIQADHPEFYMSDTTEYVSGALVSDTTNGAVFDRSLTVRGVKLVAAGAVGGATTVPDEWVKKTAQAVKLLIDPNGDSIDITQQKNLIATLKGDAGTTHAGTPTAQRIGYGGESSYSPNWLLDAGIPSYAGYQTFLDSHAVNDMVFYHGTPGDLNPSTSDRDIEETMEHLFHTIHNFGIPGAVEGSATQVPMETLLLILNGNPSFSWTTTELHLAMKEAIDAGLYDPSGYSTDWATDPDEATKVYKEYTYLVNWSMWDMSEFWDGGSLSPEWDDTLKTPAGMSANNPLGYAMFNKYFAPVLSKPDFNILKRIYQDGDAGVSGYAAQPSASRVQEINWYSGSGLSGTQADGFYTDYDGHGTHCAGIAAGKTFGWAKNSRVYSQKLGGLEGTSDPNSGISITNAFDTIRIWHNNKPIDPVTGYKRPTVVNMSWGYGTTKIEDPASGTYRGAAWTYGVDYSTRAELESATGVNINRTSIAGNPAVAISVRVTSVDAEIEEMISDGIHVIIAAGNNYNKIDSATGSDYNNQVVFGSTTYSYHRGSSPYSTNAFMVASSDTTVDGSNLDKTSIYSSRGPGCNIWAPGTYIMSATSNDYNVNKFTPINYGSNASYKQMSISGTSMAAPQVAGLCCLHLEVFPDLAPAEIQKRILGESKEVMSTTSADNDYQNVTTSIMGQSTKFLYSKYNSATPWVLTGPSNISIGN